MIITNEEKFLKKLKENINIESLKGEEKILS